MTQRTRLTRHLPGSRLAPTAADPAQLAARLRDNTTDGASALARQALAALRRYAEVHPQDERGILRCAETLRDARPSMAAVGRLLQHWLDTCPRGHASAGEFAVAHCDALLALAEQARRDTVRLAREHLARIPGTVVTHSASGTVRDALAERRPADIVAAASHPGGEGRAFADALRARCVEDAEAVRLAAHCGAVLVGADAIGRRSFVNKVGTRPLAVAARRAGRPFLVVAESFKRVDADAPHVAEPAFEAIDNDLVTQFLTDHRFPPGPAGHGS